MKIEDALHCYVCGKPLSKEFTLVTLSKETDRVFVMHNKCADQVETGTILITITAHNIKETK